MQTGLLVLITLVALTFAALAAGIKLNIKLSTSTKKNKANADRLAAEDLLALVVGMPLGDFLVEGDSVEIVVRANGHPIADKAYTAEVLEGKTKLSNEDSIAQTGNAQAIQG
jgi:hypothetical protein